MATTSCAARAAPVSTTIQGPWQIEATGLPVSKNAFTNATAFGWILSASGISDVSIIDDHQHQMRVGDVTIDRMA